MIIFTVKSSFSRIKIDLHELLARELFSEIVCGKIGPEVDNREFRGPPVRDRPARCFNCGHS